MLKKYNNNKSIKLYKKNILIVLIYFFICLIFVSINKSFTINYLIFFCKTNTFFF